MIQIAASMTVFPPTLKSHSRAASMPRWHKWLAIFAVLWTVTLYTDAATHHHRTLAQDLGCPVCHVASHNAVNVFQPDTRVAATIASWYLLKSPTADTGLVYSRPTIVPPSRASPAPAPVNVN